MGGVSRRGALAGVGLAATSAGCVGRVRNIAGREGPSQLELTIRTTPADEDPNGVRIARSLAENLDAVGVDTRVDTLGGADLRRAVLLNHDFDLYVGQFTEVLPFDPDALYTLAHSRFAAESGWQNPFGFTDLAVDDLLEAQRTTAGVEREDVVEELQGMICERQPFTVVGFPDALAAVRADTFVGWETNPPISALGLLALDRVVGGGDGDDDGDPDGGSNASADADEGLVDDSLDRDSLDGDPLEEITLDDADGEAVTLRLATTDGRITENWNPIAAEYRRHGTFTSLLYDRLAVRDDGTVIPWLARDWERTGPRTVRVTLRDARWHDGEALTAADVAFTYSFLRDTSMGTAETPVPTPQFRGRSAVVESAVAVDDSTVRLTVGDAERPVMERALQVPILPEHRWRERTDPATVAGFDLDAETTEALVATNDDPVGSGPLRFVESTPEESVTFERNPDHFLGRFGPDMDPNASPADSANRIPNMYRGEPAFDRLEVEVVGSDVAAVQRVDDGHADGTVSNLGPDAVPRIGREAGTRLVSTRSSAFYYVGYNTRRAPLSNPRFRGIVASLVDKSRLVNEAFAGYAQAASSPLAASPTWVPEELQWDDERGRDPVYPFHGEDGEVDVEAVRDALRDAGYRFDGADRLLARDP